jgi:hypothetical protein
MPDLPDYAYCTGCGRVIAWDEYGYVHLDGWANCRSKDKPDKLDGNTHCQPDLEHPIVPQPKTWAKAYQIPIREPV